MTCAGVGAGGGGAVVSPGLGGGGGGGGAAGGADTTGGRGGDTAGRPARPVSRNKRFGAASSAGEPSAMAAVSIASMPINARYEASSMGGQVAPASAGAMSAAGAG